MSSVKPRSVLSTISKTNRRLARTYNFSDDEQRLRVTGFVNNKMYNSKLVSVCAILSTLDGKYLACLRRNSFLYSEIRKSKSRKRNINLLTKYSKFLRPGELKELKTLHSINKTFVDGNNKGNVIFPGGSPKRGENAVKCISRELKEETNIDSKHVSLDTRFFVYVNIDDLLTGKEYDAIFFLGTVNLTSDEIVDNFFSNDEVVTLLFLSPYGQGIACDIIRYALSIQQLDCWGTRGYKNSYLS
ncbi:mRNA decapping enzyme [Pteropox virus]|uniref:mRNA decapping enzyme n=1 Tax=Pteropox virus TaxID=1873698 RepID=A0A1B1MRG7_9POXV|nr:mRNA decapping enzyme [Pteropox virus]ANS71174.1 mRNA decapping enzyme [Pteropox virus]